MMTTYDVFLSHASADKPWVEALARRLSEDGLKPFLDKWHLVPGEPWQEALEQALEASRTCAVFIGAKLGPCGVAPGAGTDTLAVPYRANLMSFAGFMVGRVVTFGWAAWRLERES